MQMNTFSKIKLIDRITKIMTDELIHLSNGQKQKAQAIAVIIHALPLNH